MSNKVSLRNLDSARRGSISPSTGKKCLTERAKPVLEKDWRGKIDGEARLKEPKLLIGNVLLAI